MFRVLTGVEARRPLDEFASRLAAAGLSRQPPVVRPI